ncbi:MAG: NUDIX hydrolase [Actinomycetota bacterium]
MVTAERLDWAQRLQSIAQSGLAYGDTSVYDRERYEQVRRIAAEMISSNGNADEFEAVFAAEAGHATPKLDVRGAVFRDDAILLVRERVKKSAGTWTLPGGWVDVGESPGEAVVREVREESGYETRAVKLLALYDRNRHPHPPNPWHIWKACFLCELVDGVQHELDDEIAEARFFARDELPELDLARITPDSYIDRFYAHREHPEWPTDFD